MPILETFNLKFHSGIHIGTRGIEQEQTLAYIPADTLFAALVAMRVRLMDDTLAWVERFKGQPPFRLTSAFPFVGKVRFYPRPVPAFQGILPKEWRRVKFISEQVLRHWQQNDLPASWLPKAGQDAPENGLTFQNGALWFSREEIPGLPEAFRTRKSNHGLRLEPLPAEAIQRQVVWAEAAIPRVSVDRLGNQSDIYHVGRVSFAEECGLWCGVEWRDMTQRGQVLEILTALGDSGIGAERSAGYGAFTFAPSESVEWADPKPGGIMLLLSRYYPLAEEAVSVLQTKSAAYELVYVAGYVKADGQPSQRRRGVHLVAEGSLVGSHAQGQLVDVKPTAGSFPHSVWRYGLALGLEAPQ